ncbi:hypothetical protein [Burkholderia glumae]|uniref:hypothetical protein n=1 Tax=Burkholderia glumae TaxID=337 RepID=UPI0011D1A942|nr:hypothetical protein [Burkholderia glumae]
MTDDESKPSTRLGDLSIAIRLDAPITIHFNPYEKDAVIEGNVSIGPSAQKLAIGVALTPEALRELASRLRDVEKFLGMPIAAFDPPTTKQ